MTRTNRKRQHLSAFAFQSSFPYTRPNGWSKNWQLMRSTPTTLLWINFSSPRSVCQSQALIFLLFTDIHCCSIQLRTLWCPTKNATEVSSRGPWAIRRVLPYRSATTPHGRSSRSREAQRVQQDARAAICTSRRLIRFYMWGWYVLGVTDNFGGLWFDMHMTRYIRS